MTTPRQRLRARGGILAARIACLLVAASPLIAAAVAAPVVDLSPPQPAPAPIAQSQVAPSPVQTRLTFDDRTERELQRVERRVTDRLDRIAERVHFAVSLRDEGSGASYHHGSGRFQTASLVKVHLAALMLWRADRTGVPLTRQQRTDLRQMLVRSENEPATRTYFALGGPAAIERDLVLAFGQARTHIGAFGLWGSSTTRPRDVVALLRTVLAQEDRSARRYRLMQRAMARVVPEQRWGVTSLADPGSRPQVKVGWVSSSTGWVVNSSGRSLVDGEPVIVSVMTDGHPSIEAGRAAIEEIVRPLGQLVRAQREHGAALSTMLTHLERCFVARPSTLPC